MLLHILLGILIVVAVSLTVIILFQRSEGGALGMGGGGGGQFMSARGASDLLTRTTQVLAAIFFVLSLTITILTGRATGTAAAISDLDVADIDTSKPAAASGGLTAPAPTLGNTPFGEPAAQAPAGFTVPPPAAAPASPAPVPTPAP